jgi:hypothetical protein
VKFHPWQQHTCNQSNQFHGSHHLQLPNSSSTTTTQSIAQTWHPQIDLRVSRIATKPSASSHKHKKSRKPETILCITDKPSCRRRSLDAAPIDDHPLPPQQLSTPCHLRPKPTAAAIKDEPVLCPCRVAFVAPFPSYQAVSSDVVAAALNLRVADPKSGNLPSCPLP